ncbi:hypothetical protein [Haloarchaeobius sp. HME9146]|uniref:hypothetical protein n=1 Tax=Haloarchaeobius sp. HME9146 TaxID=2978732 RepID=UPI0021C0A8DB|nr:hypothetical protein [Haloarchaeobius sp. HME9146]MCT9096330.1 hypothetical protein [Haloarchaeobius sp. HME9146]
MPELTISPEQQEFLESVRSEIQAEVRYGHVRPQDALQYLIDHYDGDDIDLEVDGAAASPAQTEAVDWSSDEVDADEEQEAAEAVSAADSDEDATAEADGGATTDSTPDSGEDRLNAMMNLMDTHEDKWREASKEDARYEVDMPDGTTEYVQTKDDVRAHLFKNY